MLGFFNSALVATSSFCMAGMPFRFVNPNYHVILIHYPLGVFVMGVLIELLGFLWPKSSVRNAARWMILIGALSAIPASTSGIYALYDVAHHQRPITGIRYHQLYWHVVLQGAGTLLAMAIAAFGLAASDRWRRKAYLPMLLGLVVVWGVFVAGAWHGGETVYAQGTAVRKLPSETGETESAPAPVPIHSKKAIDFYLGGLIQIHMIVAGVAFALAIGAMALSIRKFSSTYPDPDEAGTPASLEKEGAETARDDVAMMRSFSAEIPPPPLVERIYPASQFWLVATLVAIITFGVGYCIWAMGEGNWSPSDFYTGAMTEAYKIVINRIAVHIWMGILILLLCLILAALSRWATQRALFLGIFATLVVLAMAAQVWLGVLLTFDSPDGPLFRFNPPSTEKSHEETGGNFQPPEVKVGIES